MRGFLSALAPLCLLLAGATAADDTWETGSLAPPTSLLEYSSELLTLCKPRNIEIVSGRPIPTNAWWGNLVSCDNSSDPTTVWAQPLAVIVDSTNTDDIYYGFGLSYPYRNRFFGNLTSAGVAQFYGHAVRKEFVVSALEFLTTAPTTRVVDWTDLGVRVQMKLPSTTKVLETSMVSGMAFFTSTFTSLTPRFMIEEPLKTINGVTVTTGLILSGSRFVLTTVTGKSWILYTQSAATGAGSTVLLKAESNMVLRTVAAFNGVLRVSAVVDSTQSAAHDAYSSCVVSGGTVGITSNSEYKFQWQTSGNCSKGLYHYALDHHVRTVSSSSVAMASGVTMYSTTRGPMTALITRTSSPVWMLAEPNTIPVTFYPRKRPTTSDMSALSMLTRLVADVQSP